MRALSSHYCFQNINISARAVLNTPRFPTSILEIAGGEYLHLGFQRGLISILQSPPSMIPDILQIDFNTDGITFDKKSKISMWPIQIKVANIHKSPAEVVGVYKDKGKATNATDFMKYFVDEVLLTLQDGIEFNGNSIPIVLRCFIADAPARAFVLGYLGHTSLVPCSRCWIRGEYIRPGVIAFTDTNFQIRTREEYEMKMDVEHHDDRECSIHRLPMNLVSQTVFDYMHLVCLGIMEKILQATIDGKYSSTAKLPPDYVEILASRLDVVATFCPQEFARQPVEVTKHSKYKATEYRQLLLYSGPVVFSGLLNPAVYTHFLVLHTAMRVLIDPLSTPESISTAEILMEIFVSRAPSIYGIEFMSYNTHGLLHLASDVRSFGNLNSQSAFIFENNMTYFRRLCRKPSQLLQQIANRTAEGCKVNVPKRAKTSLKFIEKHVKGPEPLSRVCYEQYATVITGSCRISIYQKSNTVLLHDGSICVVQNIIKYSNGACNLLVKYFTSVEDYFDLGCCSSSSVGVLLCSALSSENSLIRLEEVKNKCFRMPYWSETSALDFVDGYYVVVTIFSSTFQMLPLN